MRKSGWLLLSPLTLGLAIFIIISAAFMQQVWQYLGRLLGQGTLRFFCLLLYLSTAIFMIFRAVKSGLKPSRIIASVGITVAGFVFAWRQPFFVEKMHVLEYGVLGWLATRDLCSGSCIKKIKPIILSLLFIALIGSLDEGFQKFLPYRVGEIRDVITNVISGGIGITLSLLK